jgi:guanylate kinase
VFCGSLVEMWLISVALTVVVLLLLFFRKRLFKKARPPKKNVDALVFSGPSGVGKGTIIKKLMEQRPSTFGFCVSHTSRPPRGTEKDGVDYHFVDLEKMKEMEARGEFLECCTVHGNMYGTSRGALKQVQQTGRVPIIEIDVQGAQKVRKQQGSMNIYYFFIRPPSMEELEKRIVGRGQETAEKIKTRLETARTEIAFVDDDKSKTYDKILTNTNLDETVQIVNRLLKLYCGL